MTRNPMIQKALHPLWLRGFFGSVEEDVREVEEVEFALCPRQGGVQPPQPFEVHAFFRHVALIDDHGRPLAALAFVAREGVGEFDLKRLVARVGVGGFVDFGLAPKVRMVCADVVVQGLALGP